jgi:hypothetical protein
MRDSNSVMKIAVFIACSLWVEMICAQEFSYFYYSNGGVVYSEIDPVLGAEISFTKPGYENDVLETIYVCSDESSYICIVGPWRLLVAIPRVLNDQATWVFGGYQFSIKSFVEVRGGAYYLVTATESAASEASPNQTSKMETTFVISNSGVLKSAERTVINKNDVDRKLMFIFNDGLKIDDLGKKINQQFVLNSEVLRLAEPTFKASDLVTYVMYKKLPE